MADDRTTVTELSTALGMLGHPNVQAALDARPPTLVNLTTLDWDRLDALYAAGGHSAAFTSGFDNGAAFLTSPGALRDRIPLLIEWKGAHKAPGDEPVPADLRVDHVYLISCKYLSRNLHNRSPSRIFDRLLGPGGTDPGDWYQRAAPDQYQSLYETAAAITGNDSLPARVEELLPAHRLILRSALRPRGWPKTAVEPYAKLCRQVSAFTADHWSTRIANHAAAEALVWRLLRIGSAPYFILGSDPLQPLRLRIDTPWDWRQRYQFRRLTISPAPAGQPQVTWTVEYTERATGHTKTATGHVEIRWSHGRFAGNPEAKVYLDTTHHDIPGYAKLSNGTPRLTAPSHAVAFPTG